QRKPRRDAKEIMMSIFTSIGKNVVSIALWLAVTFPPYAFLIVVAGVNLWFAIGVTIYLLFVSRIYWFLEGKIWSAK
ncbi:hypothetical protein LCGC14_1668090, partial [marine sediment metagenome]